MVKCGAKCKIYKGCEFAYKNGLILKKKLIKYIKYIKLCICVIQMVEGDRQCKIYKRYKSSNMRYKKIVEFALYKWLNANKRNVKLLKYAL